MYVREPLLLREKDWMRGFEPFILYNDFSTGATRCPLPRERGDMIT